MKNIITILFLSCTFGLSAQGKMAKADSYFTNFEFNKAIPLYLELADSKHNKEGYVSQKLGDSYFNTIDYINAAKWYGKLYTRNGSTIGESNIIKLIQSLKASGDVEGADKIIAQYYQDESRLEMILAQKSHLDSMLNEGAKFNIENMAFNSNRSDFAPTMYIDQMVFASSRDSVESKKEVYQWNGQPYLDLYITYPHRPEHEPKKFLNNMESSFHDATMSYHRKTNKVYFTRNYFSKDKLNPNKQGISNMKILMGEVSQGALINEEVLDFSDNSYSVGHPAITKEGRYLYFTSNMPGGYGETDIYVVELSQEGYPISKPINLGTSINTPGREMFPFVDKEGILYFASDGHYGFGGLDVFISKIESKTTYTLPKNMGQPINGNMDDFSLIYNPSSEEGYFASNRSNGKGDDDIYRFTKVKPVDCLTYSGVVLNTSTGEPIHKADIELFNTNGTISYVKTGADGFFEFTLPCNMENQLLFSKNGFSKKDVSIITGAEVQKDSKNNKIYLTPYESLVEKDGENEKISVDPIYFDYNKWDITQRAEIELQKVLFAMKEFPKLKIKIESHTDSRGSDVYNMDLSDNRAKSTRRYLISKGIDADRIESANGYGEYRLKNECADGVVCNEKKHFENRRSDFIVVVK